MVRHSCTTHFVVDDSLSFGHVSCAALKSRAIPGTFIGMKTVIKTNRNVGGFFWMRNIVSIKSQPFPTWKGLLQTFVIK